MPNADGKIRGISIPSVPWHENARANTLTKTGQSVTVEATYSAEELDSINTRRRFDIDMTFPPSIKRESLSSK